MRFARQQFSRFRTKRCGFGQHLERNLAFEASVLRQIHGPHPSSPKKRNQSVLPDLLGHWPVGIVCRESGTVGRRMRTLICPKHRQARFSSFLHRTRFIERRIETVPMTAELLDNLVLSG